MLDQEPRVSRSTSDQTSYLDDAETQLSALRSNAADIADRLQNAGFYGPPQEASKGEHPPVENNVRSRITSEIRSLRAVIDALNHQTRSLVG